MFKFLNLAPEVFGMDINDLSIKIAKLKKTRKGFVLVSFNETRITPNVVLDGVIQDPAALSKAILHAYESVKGKKLGTRCVAFSLPEEKSFSQIIKLPVLSQEELVSAVPLEAANYIPLPIHKVYLDFQMISSHGNKDGASHMDLLINAMPTTIVDSYVTCVKNAGLTPYILEVESQAIVRSLFNANMKNQSLIFVDFGETKTSLIIFSNNLIHFTSSIAISSQQLTDNISRALGVTTQEAELMKIRYGLVKQKLKKNNIEDIIRPTLHDLAAQIKKYINFYQDHLFDEYIPQDSKIEKIILSGGGANLKKLPKFLSEELQILVEIGNPFANVLVPHVKGRPVMDYEKSLSFATAFGLALRGADHQDYMQ